MVEMLCRATCLIMFVTKNNVKFKQANKSEVDTQKQPLIVLRGLFIGINSFHGTWPAAAKRKTLVQVHCHGNTPLLCLFLRVI